jgi:hypothetical protein
MEKDTLMQTFTIEEKDPLLDTSHTIELKEGGGEIWVDETNKKEFIQLLYFIQYLLDF